MSRDRCCSFCTCPYHGHHNTRRHDVKIVTREGFTYTFRGRRFEIVRELQRYLGAEVHLVHDESPGQIAWLLEGFPVGTKLVSVSHTRRPDYSSWESGVDPILWTG